LDKAAKEKDLIREHPEGELLVSSAGWELNHPNLRINIRYDILLGRQSVLAEDGKHRKIHFNSSDIIELIPCDIFLKGAKKMDNFPDVYS
jgi:hypothetical protein